MTNLASSFSFSHPPVAYTVLGAFLVWIGAVAAMVAAG